MFKFLNLGQDTQISSDNFFRKSYGYYLIFYFLELFALP
jgi:hypothetical protein